MPYDRSIPNDEPNQQRPAPRHPIHTRPRAIGVACSLASLSSIDHIRNMSLSLAGPPPLARVAHNRKQSRVSEPQVTLGIKHLHYNFTVDYNILLILFTAYRACSY